MPINELTASAPASPDNSLSSQDAEIYDRMDWRHVRSGLFGRRLSVVSFGSSKFLIGVQIASLLKRETFNMYRSMKIKNVDIQRASPQQVDFLAKVNAVRPGTHSVTLIPYDDGLYFVADAWVKQHKDDILMTTKSSPSSSSSSSSSSAAKSKAIKSFIQERPKLHRRKPLPWDIHRSIKKNDIKDPSKYILTPEYDFPFTTSSSSSSCISYSAPCSPISPTELLTAAAASLAAADSLMEQAQSSTPVTRSASASASAFAFGGPSPRAFYCR